LESKRINEQSQNQSLPAVSHVLAFVKALTSGIADRIRSAAVTGHDTMLDGAT
jgi:hypothetical protein